MRAWRRKLQARRSVKVVFTKLYGGQRRSDAVQSKGSPEWRAIASRTLSRKRTTSCQSEAFRSGSIGAESVMVTLVGRGSRVPSRRKRRVPESETGTIGTPVVTAV